MITKPFKIDSTVHFIINRLNKYGTTFLVGGYLRDTLLDKKPSDVDLLTCIPFQKLKEIFPYFSYTENGEKFGIGRFTYKQTLFEIHSIYHLLSEYHLPVNSFLNDEEKQILLKKELYEKDFTINSFYYEDGCIYGEKTWFQHLENKIIHFNEEPAKHLMKNPQSFIRSIRLSSEIGFSLSDEVIHFYSTHNHFFFEIPTQRLTTEAYKILSSIYPLYSFYYLNRFHLLNSDMDTSTLLNLLSDYQPYATIKNQSMPNHIQLFILALFSSKQTILNWCKLFLTSEDMSNRFLYFYDKYKDIDFKNHSFSTSFDIPTHPVELSDLLWVYKFFSRHDPKTMKEIYTLIKNKKIKK